MPQFLTQEEVDQYYREGYLLAKAVYSVKTIDQIRDILAKALKNGTWQSAPYHNEGITTDIYRTMPELVDLIFNENYVQVFKDLYGPQMVILPEPAIHRNRFYYWHKDSTFIDEQGKDFHWNEDFNAIMSAMYLQDNDPIYGGGITVAPRTHHNRDYHHKVAHMNLAERIVLKAKKLAGISFYDQLEKHPDLTRIESKKGDLVVLDMRVDHKGSTPKAYRTDFDKFAIMNIIANNRKYTEAINQCLRARPSGYYTEYLSKDIQLPQKLVDRAKELDFETDF
ncbi:MAG: phytanoyl-CoA dioxygenase family protein [Bacteroidota bacterium]